MPEMMYTPLVAGLHFLHDPRAKYNSVQHVKPLSGESIRDGGNSLVGWVFTIALSYGCGCIVSFIYLDTRAIYLFLVRVSVYGLSRATGDGRSSSQHTPGRPSPQKGGFRSCASQGNGSFGLDLNPHHRILTMAREKSFGLTSFPKAEAVVENDKYLAFATAEDLMIYTKVWELLVYTNSIRTNAGT